MNRFKGGNESRTPCYHNTVMALRRPYKSSTRLMVLVPIFSDSAVTLPENPQRVFGYFLNMFFPFQFTVKNDSKVFNLVCQFEFNLTSLTRVGKQHWRNVIYEYLPLSLVCLPPLILSLIYSDSLVAQLQSTQVSSYIYLVIKLK